MQNSVRHYNGRFPCECTHSKSDHMEDVGMSYTEEELKCTVPSCECKRFTLVKRK